MRNIAIVALLACLYAVPAKAQTGRQPVPTSDQARQKDPVSTWLRNAYTGNRNYLARIAEKMPAENYNMRPGPQAEVRTFGEIVGHVANFNFLWCAQAKGEKNPNQGKNFEKLASKAEFVKALNDALAYCDGAYASLTDASGEEMIQGSGPNGPQSTPRMSILILNLTHNNEHYGNLVTYMRIKSIVPPSSEPGVPR